MTPKHLPALRARTISFPGYENLKKRIGKTLLQGRRKIEVSRMEAFWNAGHAVLREE